MNEIFFLLILARNGDGEDTGWSQLLVFLVLAVFWIVGGIMKARTEKENRRQQQQKRPVQGPKPAFSKPLSQQVKRPIGQQTILKPKAAVKKTEKFDEKIPKPDEMTGTVKQAEKKFVKAAAQTTETTVEIEGPLIPEDAEQLQVAILHYEILGKPLALREDAHF